MGFYGNITDMSRTHFQFDKIFHSRTEMDNSLAMGADNVFAGRFVLVKYDFNSPYFQGDILYGFRNENDVDDLKIYVDNITYQQPYIYTTFTKVNTPNINDCENYYYKTQRFYFKLPDASYYSVEDENNYYIPNILNNDNIVCLNKIVRLKDASGNLTNTFYQCVGGYIEGQENIENNSGGTALWTEIITDNDYADYFTNFWIDSATYKDDFDTRGYDGTVWQKVYSEGQGKFIPIARLNGAVPAFELIPSIPSNYPASPYIDSKSTDSLYRIHIPSHWGFRIKEAEPETGTNGADIYPLCDQIISQEYLEYDRDNNLIGPITRHDVKAEIYFNKKANNKLYNYRDDETENRINIEQTGESGKIYYDKDNNPLTLDTYELSIHLPMIGNMIADGYDLIYGPGEGTNEEGLILRPTDIEWYSGDSSSELKQNGNSIYGGKTHELTTLAGSLNTMHDIIGQIVINLDSFPNEDQINTLSPEYLYRYNGKYYRKGYIIDKTIVENGYTYTQQTNVTQEQFIPNKYYYESSPNVYEPAESYDSLLGANGYYLRNINSIRYVPIDLIQFEPETYYLQEGENYICDNSPDYPMYPNRTYYEVTSDAGRHFTGQYTPGRFFTLENNNYILSNDIIPQLNTTYYDVQGNSLGQQRYYHPGSFYYKNNDNTFTLAEEENYDSTKTYYALTFGDTPHYGYNSLGQVIQYYEVIHEERDILFSVLPNGITFDDLYTYENGKYIAYENIKDDIVLDTHRDPYTVVRYYYTLPSITTYPSGELYLPGVYYIKNSEQSYIKSYENLDIAETYYLINNVERVEDPFYVPDMYYYYLSDQDEYELSKSLRMIYDTYYKKSAMYVYSDETGACPYGYEWNDYSSYVPPSIVLYTAEKKFGLIEISELGKNTNCLYGLLLELNKLYAPGQEEIRDVDTVRGAYNVLQDLLYQVKTLKPNHLLCVNDFGQIESISLSDLKTKLNNI